MKPFYLIIALFFSAAVQAADKDIYSDKNGAIRGADPVAYFSLESKQGAVIGSDKLTYEYKGATWKFISDENRKKFISNPDKYTPQYGGYCAFAISHGFTKAVDPNYWKIVDEKLYLNYNETAYKKWLKDESGAITRADKNWAAVLQNCEKNNTCGKGIE